MTEQELRDRVYNLIVFLREELGMSYEDIEIFWRKCIEEANENEN